MLPISCSLVNAVKSIMFCCLFVSFLSLISYSWILLSYCLYDCSFILHQICVLSRLDFFLHHLRIVESQTRRKRHWTFSTHKYSVFSLILQKIEANSHKSSSVGCNIFIVLRDNRGIVFIKTINNLF